MIFIRVDANSNIGMGHMMRCLSIADAFTKVGKNVAFICANDTNTDSIEERGYGYCKLSTSYTEMMNEISAVSEALLGMDAELLIVDSYQVTREYFFALKPFVKLCLIEDLAGTNYPVDYLINYNLYANVEDYKDCYPKTKLLLGPKYAPLRDEFCKTNYSVKEEVSNILITTGGADLYNLSTGFANALTRNEKTKNCHITIVSGGLNTHLDDLKKIKKEHANINLIVNADNMAKLMSQSDIVVSAAGSTVCELICVGVPFVCVSFVDNQQKIYEYCKNNNISIGSLDYQADGEKIFDQMTEAVNAAFDDFTYRKSLSEREKKIVDGLGASNIVKDILFDE